MDAAKGTGVFLPAVPSETESHSEASQGAKKDLGSSGSEMDTDSDIDSADSASDCIMLPTTLKRGELRLPCNPSSPCLRQEFIDSCLEYINSTVQLLVSICLTTSSLCYYDDADMPLQSSIKP